MTKNPAFASLATTIRQATRYVWQTAQRYLTVEPAPLWQKAMEESRHHAYRQFKSDLEHTSETALRNIVSPYAVIANVNSMPQIKTSIEKLLRLNPEKTLRYFYDDVMNHLVELSFGSIDVEAFKAMLALYKSYVPDDIYQKILMGCEVIDKTNANLQSRIIDATKQINQAFKRFQSDRNAERGTEQAQAAENSAQKNHEQHHRPNVNQLIVMSAISLLANKNHLGFSLGLATTALFADSVDAALPTVANPIAAQYAEVGQAFSYDVDLNHVFNDADGDIMTFGGVTMADGSPLPNWLSANPRKLYGRDYANEAYDVAILGDIAYVANGQFGLVMFNISNPANKLFIGSYDLPGSAQGISVQNNIAYIADGSFGLHCINISNLTNLIWLGSYDTPGNAYAVAVRNSVAYVADEAFGLQLINVSNPTNLSLLATYNTTGNAYGVTVKDNIAYVVGDNFGLQLINVTSSNDLIPLGNYTSNAEDVVLVEQVAYIAAGSAGLHLINVSNPNNLVLLHTQGTCNAAHGVTVQNGVAYVAVHNCGLDLINVTHVNNPIPLANYHLPGVAYDVIVQTDVAYVATTSGLYPINVSIPNNPMLLGDNTLGEAAEKIIIQNNTLYLANGAAGLQLIDVRVPNRPHLLFNQGTCNAAHDVTVQNAVAYVTVHNCGLALMNVSTPTQPSELGNYNHLPGVAFDVVVQDDVAYVATALGLYVVNVSVPNNVTLLGNYNTTGTAYAVVVQGAIAYLADGYLGLQLINVSNPTNLTLLSHYNISGYAYVYGLFIQNDVVYVADDFLGLLLINVSNASRPTFLSRFDTPGAAFDVTVQNGVAYVADGYSGIQMINISNPNVLSLLGSYDTPGFAQGVTLQNGTCYVADSAWGIHVLDLKHIQLSGIVPSNATGSYNLRISATNTHSEWIATNVELRIAVPSSTTAQMTASLSQSVQGAPSIKTSTSQTSDQSIFAIVSTPVPIVIESGISTFITTNMLSITGNINANQVIYTVQENNPDIIITVNGEEATQFTQADVEGQFVAIELQGTGCQDYDNTLQLQASVAGSSTTVDFSLSVQVNTLSCNAGSLLRDTAVSTIAALLTTTGLGFLAKGRKQRERGQCAEPAPCLVAMRQTH